MGHRRKRAIDVGPTTAVVRIPTPPNGLLPATRKAWRVYWRSAAASLTTETDRPAIERLFMLYDVQARALDLARQSMVVLGSTRQVRVNPLFDLVLRIEAAISRLEGELGITPAGRMRLGLEVSGERAPTLADLNARADDGRDARADPRRVLIDLQDRRHQEQGVG